MNKLGWLTEKIRKHKKLLIFGVIGVIIVAVGVSVVSNMNRKKEQMMAMMNQTQTSKVEKRTLVSSVSATGTVTSVNSKSVTANLSGMEVKSVSVEVGDMVEAGQVICALDSEEIEENLADAKQALNVSNEKTKMDLTAAERSLQDVLDDYNLDMERGNEELLSAYQDYEDAVKDLEEAKKEWDEAIQTTKDYKAEYDYQNGLLTAAEENKESMNTSSAYSQEFNITKNMLIEYAKNNAVTMNNAVESRLVIGRDLSGITVGTTGTEDFFIGTPKGNAAGNSGEASGVSDTEDDSENNRNPLNESDTEEASENEVSIISEPEVNENQDISQEYDGNTDTDAIVKKIKGYLSALNNLSSKYNSANHLDESYNTYKQDASTWESKYKTAQQDEASAEKAYEQAVSALESSIEAYEKQLRNLDDTKKSGENSILSKSESLYSTQLNSLTSGDSEEKKIEEYQEQLQDCNVKSPISGVVTEVNVEVGDMYNGSAIVTIEDISGYEVSTEIDEYDIGKIEKGQKVIIKTNATGEEELEGTVTRISPRASSGGSEVTYTVNVSIDTLHEMLRMDMTAKLSIILESKENVLTVPYEAVQEDESGKFYVEVVTDSVSMNPEDGEMPQMSNKDKAGSSSKSKGSRTPGGNAGNTDIATRKVYVEKGIESDYYIEIISNEISEGMEIVVPSTERNGGGMDIQNMMMRQGPMGGF